MTPVKNLEKDHRPAQDVDMGPSVVQLVRLALSGRTRDVELLSRRLSVRLAATRPELSADLQKVLAETAAASEIARSKAAAVPLPVDADSRLELLKRDIAPSIDGDPVWPADIMHEFNSLLAERQRADELLLAGLSPSRSLLLSGPPGVGKTMAARWIAGQLNRPLLTLDLSSVMSSYLGKTGSNIRVVLDYARRQPSVLLLDEFDAIAKRRDDAAEVGELKRLVTVLIQAIDEWPADGLLIAATNHPELLDPAIWRRFDRVLDLALPTEQVLERLLRRLVGDDTPPATLANLASTMMGKSHAEVTRDILRARRQAVLSNGDFVQLLLAAPVQRGRSATKRRLALANDLRAKGLSERDISLRTGLSRTTLSKYRNTDEGSTSNGAEE